MPFTVITLKKVPNSLRGDLTRWMQEITTGVYVGNYNSRVREYLWERVTDTVGQGEATMCYSCRNEIGYSFCTCNTERQVVDYDGIPLVMIPEKDSPKENCNSDFLGYSDAGKYHHAVRKVGAESVKKEKTVKKENKVSVLNDASGGQQVHDLVFLDIETTGLNVERDRIIEIGAIKISGEDETEFHRLIRASIGVPDVVRDLTGITDEMLSEGTSFENSICDFNEFIKGAVLVGYNISFDIKFLNSAFEKFSLGPIHNKTLDLMQEAKKKNSFQANYKFETTLQEYGIDQSPPHRALEDAKLTHRLFIRMKSI